MKHLKFILSFVFLACISLFIQAQYAKFDVDAIEGCDSLLVHFTNTSDPGGIIVQYYVLKFGDGEELKNSTFTSVTHKYDSVGIFNVYLEMKLQSIINPIISDITPIKVRPHPNAFFFVADTFQISNLAYRFRSGKAPDSTIVYRYVWKLNPQPNSDSIVHTPGNEPPLRDTLIYRFSQEVSNIMRLKVNDDFGCVDSFEQPFNVAAKLNVPNAFSPNGDGVNDNFSVTTNGRTIFSLKIFTIGGQLIFQSESRNISWDGNNSSGSKAWPGTYFYIIEAIGGEYVKRESGFLILFRER